MKVLCIKTAKSIGSNIKPDETPKVGEWHTVLEVSTDPYGTYFTLEEMPKDILYIEWLFAPVSEICETTFERNYNKELV